MKIPAHVPALLALCAIAALPLRAQYDMPDPNQTPPPPNNGQYQYSAPPPQQAPPPPGQQGGPDQQGAPDQNDPGPQGAPDQGASFQTFYDNLAQQGTWIQSSDYGYVWQPSVNDPEWAPYTAGHWVYSDAGWTWASDEPWGWATYHYGRWVNLDGTGWCWVPGYTWAPAWVSWRYGDGYCGWAPLPPDSFVGIDYTGGGIDLSLGFHIGGDCDAYYGIGAGCYNFIPCAFIGYTNYHGHYANRYNNYALINRTTNVTNLNVNRNGGHEGGPRNFGHVTTGGPSFAQVNAVSQTPVQRVNLTSASRPGVSRVSNNSLAIYAPHVAPGATGQPAHVSETLGRATINRGVDVTRPLAVNRNLAAPAPTQSQIQTAQLSQYSAPARAKVVTSSTQVNPILQSPLSTLKPVAATPHVNAVSSQSNLNNGGNVPHQQAMQGTSQAQANPFFPSQHAQSGGPVVHPQGSVNVQTQSQSVPVHAAVSQSSPYAQTQHQATPQATSTVVHHSQTYVPQANAPQHAQQDNAPAQAASNSQSQAPSAPSYNQGGGGYNNGGNNQGGNGGGYHGGGGQHNH